MNKFQKSILTLGAMVILVTAPAANATLFNDAVVDLGSGYGVDNSENSIDNPTLLDVRYLSAFSDAGFSLADIGSSYTFVLGEFGFFELNTGGGILFDETDNLGVKANFTFLSPLGLDQTVSALALVAASTGAVADAAVDYTIDWSPVMVDFGLDGLFEIALNDISFTGHGAQTLTATITRVPSSTGDAIAVPEPAALTLLGLGFVGFAASGRRPAMRASH